MAGVAQVWLTEDELDLIVKAVVRYIPKKVGQFGSLVTNQDDMATRQAVLDKLRPLAYGVSCDVASGGGCEITTGACPGDELTALK